MQKSPPDPNIQLVVIPARFVHADYREYYNQAYNLWKSVWAETYEALDGLDHLCSDDFTRQDEILCLFSGRKCVALVFFRFIDLQDHAHRDDTYFKVWPDEAMTGLKREGSKVLLGSYITTDESVRRGSLGISIKDLLVNLSVKKFIASSANAMTGVMRNNKGMSKCVYNVGAETLVQNHMAHNVSVDIVAYFKKTVRVAEEYKFLVDRLWKNKIQFSDTSLFEKLNFETFKKTG